MIDRRTFVATGAAGLTAPAMAQVSGRTCYTMSFDKLHGDGEIRLGDYASKPILVVNTASLCGFTPQYEGLQALWAQFSPHGLMMIGAPSNDFGGQEPGGPTEIQHTVEHYGASFPMAAKVKVTGADAHPFYRWAAAERPRELPRWNFHKYLIGRDGHVAAVFDTNVTPMDQRVIAAVEKEFTSGRG